MPWRGIAVPELGIDARNDRYDESEEVVDIVIKIQNLMAVYDLLVMCKYAHTADAASKVDIVFTDVSRADDVINVYMGPILRC